MVRRCNREPAIQIVRVFRESGSASAGNCKKKNAVLALEVGLRTRPCCSPTQRRRRPTPSPVLAPIGTAMLGYRVGDVIEWPVPKTLRRLEVLEVVYQPEAHAEMSRA